MARELPDKVDGAPASWRYLDVLDLHEAIVVVDLAAEQGGSSWVIPRNVVTTPVRRDSSA